MPKKATELVNLEEVELSLETERDYCYWYELVEAACNNLPFIPLDTAKRMNLTMTAHLEEDVSLRESLSVMPAPSKRLDVLEDGHSRYESQGSYDNSYSRYDNHSRYDSQSRFNGMRNRFQSVEASRWAEGSDRGTSQPMWEGDEHRYLTEEDKKAVQMGLPSDFLEQGEQKSEQKSEQKKKGAVGRVTSMILGDSKKEKKEGRTASSSTDGPRSNTQLAPREADLRSVRGDNGRGHYDQFHEPRNDHQMEHMRPYKDRRRLEEGVVKEGTVTKYPSHNKTGSPKDRYLVLTYYRDSGGVLTYYESKQDFDRSRSYKGRIPLGGHVSVRVTFKNSRRVCAVLAEVRKEEGMEEADQYTRSESTASRSLSGMVMGSLRRLSTGEEAPHEALVFYTDGETTEDWARRISEVLEAMGSDEDSD